MVLHLVAPCTRWALEKSVVAGFFLAPRGPILLLPSPSSKSTPFVSSSTNTRRLQGLLSSLAVRQRSRLWTENCRLLQVCQLESESEETLARCIAHS